ncbi:hypothetical protein [Streptomyces globisporus]|uniref:hypothetical protein n=1 Tax=Streptomyces globisporus TaxID=1908 RepID=UPI0037A59B6A
MRPLFRKRPKPQPPTPPAPPQQQDPNRFTLRYSDKPEAVGEWLSQHGYRSVIAGALSIAHAGVIYARPGLPAEIAILGETLVYDGANVTVESES